MPGKRGDLWQRIWAKMTVDSESGCWVWRGALSTWNSSRRPSIRLGGRKTGSAIVARLVCTRYHGEPPSELHEAGHTCPKGENELCINPYHLRWMTRQENEAHKRTYEVPDR